ncbi:MAG: hypothetical protein JWR16_150 [Nevskia sp.]|nr:hypothetical protein [Nevskia sp.]
MHEFKLVAKIAAIGFAVFVSGTVLAQPIAPAAGTSDSSALVPRAGFGSQSDVWLSMQMNPAYTANDPRPIPGEVANRTFVRYLDSFSHPIPEQFERESFSSSGGGGGGGAASGSGAGSSSP